MPRGSTVAEWIITRGRHAANVPELLRGVCLQLNEAGLGLVRANVQMRTLHPEVAVHLYVWSPAGELVRRGYASIDAPMVSVFEPPALDDLVERGREDAAEGTVETIALGHGAFESPSFRASPFWRVVEAGELRVRARVDRDATTFEYPILKDVQALGATDYVAYALTFPGGPKSGCSFVTMKPDGFTDDDLADLEGLLDPLAACVDGHAARHVARSLLETYVGRSTGQKVLGGKIRRGDVERIHAAIWFSDLRGFTSLSGSVASSVLLGWLNEYFAAVAAPIARHGGEILKFIGDAVLAVFPVADTGSRAAACAAALAAARDANGELDLLNARRAEAGAPELDHGVALHVGEVLYGNIGAERRLDFTVIGSAVNTASRLEGLCGKLGRRIVVSEAVAVETGGLVPLGEFDLKGLGAQLAYGEP